MVTPRVISLRRFLLLSLSLGFLCTACSSSDKKSDTADGAYAIAQEYDKDERYDEAIHRYQEVKNKFPYSKFAQMSELSIADVYYKQESFAEAQVAYQTFKELHPKHPQIDYVTYRLAMSLFSQLPSTIDRDLTLAHTAIQNFEEVLRNFPGSQYAKEASEKKQTTQKMLSDKEIYIADFYFKTGKYSSAANRYEEQIKKYPNSDKVAHALSQATIAFIRAGDTNKASKFLEKLKEQFPDSAEYKKAEDEIKKEPKQ